MVFGLLYAVWDSGSRYGGIQTEEQIKSGKYAAAADKKIKESCLKLPIPALVKCVRDAENAAGKQKKDQRDLEAQMEMSYWAKHTFILSVVMAFITGIGLIFIYRTLNATEITAKASLDTAVATIASQRPWIKYRFMPNPKVTFDGNNYTLHISAMIENVGQTPALNVFHVVEAVPIAGFSVFNFGEPRARVRVSLKHPAARNTGQIIFPNENPVYLFKAQIKQSDLAKLTSNKFMISVATSVTYEWHGGCGETKSIGVVERQNVREFDLSAISKGANIPSEIIPCGNEAT